MDVGDLAVPMRTGALKPGEEIKLGDLSLRTSHSLPQQSAPWPWMASKKNLTFFKSCGTAAQDIVTAKAALRAAEKLNLGILH